ncbi:MAG: hypothetical protein IJ685_04430 [Selenomonadaceae bacterium]|nr:hypothetical protein [Selenomonadaceae bacterium]
MAGFFSDFFGNGGTPQQPYQPQYQLPDRFLNPSPVGEAQIRDFQNGIVADKIGWDNANKQMNLWTKQLDTPDLTDEQKQKINANIQGWNQKRDAFAANANERRNQARAIGIDISDYDEGKSLQDVTQSANTYRNSAVRDFLNLPTVNQLEEDRYRELRSKGASPRQAERILGRERAGREEDFLRRAEEGIMTYGLNPDGSLNGIGLTLARRLNPSDPAIAAQLYTGAFALPKNIFTEDRADNRTILNNTASAQRQAAQIAATQWATIFNNDAQNDRLDKTLTHQERQQDKQFAHAEKMQGLREAAEYHRKVLQLEADKIKAYLESPIGKFESWFTLGKTLYGDEKQAAEWAKTQVEKKPPSDSEEKFKAAGNLLGNRYRDIETALKDGNKDLALQNIGAIESLLRDDSNYAELLDVGAYSAALHILDTYRKVAENKYTLTQAIVEIEEIKHGKMSPDQIMAYLRNHGLFGQDDPAIIRRKVNQAIQNVQPPSEFKPVNKVSELPRSVISAR